MKYPNSPFDHITVSLEGSRLTVTLNNPRQHNRLSSTELDYLLAVIETVNNDTDIRVVVITGQGKTFCSGFDLQELDGMAGDARLPGFDVLTDSWEQLRCPSICALNGSVYGGAIDLALACDFRIAVNSAEIRMPAAKLGLHYYPAGIQRYVTRLGMAVSKRLLLCAEAYQGEALKSIGFADELVAAEALNNKVDALATAIQNNAPLAVEGMKQAINVYAAGQVDDRQIHQNFAQALASSDFKAGVQSVKLKKRPIFHRN